MDVRQRRSATVDAIERDRGRRSSDVSAVTVGERDRSTMLPTDRPLDGAEHGGGPARLYGVVRRRPTAPVGGGGAAAAQWRRRLARRSDPGLSVIYDEMDSGWDLTSPTTTTSCGVARSSSLRNSFLRGRAREPLWIQSTYSLSVAVAVVVVIIMEKFIVRLLHGEHRCIIRVINSND